MEVDLQEIDAPHGSPPTGRYFEIRNNSKQPVQIKGYREGNYVQSWQRLEYGVWIDMPKPPSFGSRIQQIALAPGATSVFRGTEGIGGDRVGIEVSQGGHTQIAWSR